MQGDTEEQHEEELKAFRDRLTISLHACPPASVAKCELVRFFEHARDLLCIAGLDGHLKQLNPEWTRRLGWTTEQLLATPFLDFVHPDDRAATKAEVAKLADGGATIGFETRCRCKDGSYRWLRWNSKAVVGRKEIYASARDITLQKQQEREIIEIVDRERERLGRELHDGLCQTLAGIAAFTCALSRELAEESASAAAPAVEITRMLNEAIGQAQDLAKGLNPTDLETGGLVVALETLANNVESMFGVACTLECDGHPGGLCPSAAAHLYRIAQEAVNNAISHGRAERLEVKLSLDRHIGLLRIRDDGVGLPESDIEANGMGRHTMAYRARMLAASLAVRRRAQGGTEVACIFPVSGTPEDDVCGDKRV